MEGGRERRVVRIDGRAAHGQAALAGVLRAVWLTPAMDRLFIEGADNRRRFLDRLVFALDPEHAGRLAAYDRALRERARLLRRGVRDDAWLAALEATMAGWAVAVAAARRDAAARLDAACADGVGPFPGARLAVAGTVEAWLDEAAAVDVEERLAARLRGARATDAEAGGAVAGPHRSDLRAWHAGRGVPAAQGSTGEQKAMLIAIVLAHARLLADTAGGVPLLLLDEVAAHLDAERREALFTTLAGLGTQAWLTGTDAALFTGPPGWAQHFRVADATLYPLDGAPDTTTTTGNDA